MNKQLLEKFSKVHKEVAKAYADVHLGYDQGSKIRNLNYCSNTPVSIDTAIDILKKYVPTYNRFSPILLEKLKEIDEDAKVYIARESSVCIYFETSKDIADLSRFTTSRYPQRSSASHIIYGHMLADELMAVKPSNCGHNWNVKTNNFIYRIWWD